MSELSDIATSVAKALGFIQSARLKDDGSNIFDSYWQVRCRDWLLERGSFIRWTDKLISYQGERVISVYCPSSEACARIIHELMKNEH